MGTGRRMLLHEDCPQEFHRVSLTSPWDRNWLKRIYKNSRIRGRRNWREIIRRFMDDPMNYLREYFRRNASESGFSSDKRTTGGLIYQRRKDRKETSGFCKGLIHNLMLLHS